MTKVPVVTHQFHVISKEKRIVQLFSKAANYLLFLYVIVLSTVFSTYLCSGKYSKAAMPRGMLPERLPWAP